MIVFDTASSWESVFHYIPVKLSRFGRYVLPTLLTPTFRSNWCSFRLGATMCHDILRCCHATTSPEPRCFPVLTRLTSDNGKFSYVVSPYVSLPPRCSLATTTLLPRCRCRTLCHVVLHCCQAAASRQF